MMRKPWRRRLVRLVLAGAVLYAVLSAALYAVMRQPPAVIGSVFKRILWPVFAALPMEPLWLRAREGTLRVGDAAPEFDLATFDKKSRVSLASLRGKPVVLVFGSYT
jgi:hypothetical protein